MKRSTYTIHFTCFVFCFILVAFLEPENGKGNLFAQDSLKPPVILPAGKPQVIQVPRTTGGSYTIQTKNGPRTIKLEPPKVFTLPVVTTSVSDAEKENESDQSFAAHGFFTTYTTDNGLAMDMAAIGQQNAFCDHLGNLWFGTSGGGVSRYDGKSFANFTTDQGLIHNHIVSIAEDREGNLWFGTFGGGVSRYDGKSFVNFTAQQGLVSNSIYTITEDDMGNLWFGTLPTGISRYDIKRAHAPCNMNTCKHDLHIQKDKEDHNKEIAKAFTTFTTAQGLSSDKIFISAKDGKGNIWFGSGDGGAFFYDGKSFVNFPENGKLPNNSVRSMHVDRKQNIWLGSTGGVLLSYNESAGGVMDYSKALGLPNATIYCIKEDRSGNMWFGTSGGGVSCYDGKCFTNYTTAQGLANNIVTAVTEDKTGNLWFSTYGGGISRFDGKSFVNFTVARGLAGNVVWSICEDNTGAFWFGTQGAGVSRYDGKSFTNFSINQGLVGNVVSSICKDRSGKIWLGTNAGGISCYEEHPKDGSGVRFTSYTPEQGLADGGIFSITEDKQGDLWICTTGGGVSCYDGHPSDGGPPRFVNYTTAQGLSSNVVVSSFLDRKGNLWFGTLGGGVSCYDGRKFNNYTTEQGLTNNSVLSIAEENTGNLWFSTAGGGVSRFDGKSFVNYTTVEGLPDNSATAIVFDNQGNIIIGTNYGIALLKHFVSKAENSSEQKLVPAQNSLSSRELKDYLPVFEIYNSLTGYPVKDVNSGLNSMFKDSKGIIWIATGSDKTGLVRFDYSKVNRNSSPPTVIIQSIKVNEENICWENLRAAKASERENKGLNKERDSLLLLVSQFNAFGKNVPQSMLDNQRTRFGDIQFDSIAKFYPLPANLVLPYNHNQISFEFAAIEPARPNMVKYQYILEGYDKEWSPVSNKTSVSFGNIDEGTYTFKLKAQSPSGIWSEPVTYTFTVTPPWWRTWWMYSFYALAGIFCVVIVAWLNGRRLRARAKELAQEVRKATATIVEQKEIVEEKNKKITDSIHYAQRIQNAILPDSTFVDTLFDDYFIYYQPKEVVSGDFYWFGKKDNKIIFAAVDCTGHGVPGAFMSMIGNTLLNEIVNEKGIVESDEILNHLRAGVIHALKQSDALESQQDGMDIALCVLDKDKNTLWFSGAYNPLYLFRNGAFTEFKSDSKTVGYEKGQDEPYQKTRIEIQKGDAMYIFTDGFADQKGGPQKRKYYYKAFQELLGSLQHEPMKQQGEILRDTFNKWRGDIEQIDDVLVIGIRI